VRIALIKIVIVVVIVMLKGSLNCNLQALSRIVSGALALPIAGANYDLD
jgi:uncharacterized membrane-anchored protein